MIPVNDLHTMTEDERIELIGLTANQMIMGRHPAIAFIVEDSDKADRYIEKLKEKFPGIVVLKRYPGPVDQTYTVEIKFGGTIQ